MDINEAVARAINAERGAANLTIRQLAEKSGIPERTLIRILKAERDIKVDQLAMLADAFGITPAQLVQESENLQSRDTTEKEERKPILRASASDGLTEAEKDALAVRMAQDPGSYSLAADDLDEEEKRMNRLGDAIGQEGDDGTV